MDCFPGKPPFRAGLLVSSRRLRGGYKPIPEEYHRRLPEKKPFYPFPDSPCADCPKRGFAFPAIYYILPETPSWRNAIPKRYKQRQKKCAESDRKKRVSRADNCTRKTIWNFLFKKNRKSIKPLRTSDINCMWQLNVRSIRQSKYPDLDSTPIPAFSIIDQWHKGTAHHHGGHTAEELHLYSIALESFFSIVAISYHPSFQNARKIFQKMKEYAPDFYREHIILSKNLVFTETGQIAS